VQKVCEKLFSHGPLTLDQLVRYTDFTKDQVRNSLLVLVQHNCAQAFVSAPQDDGNIHSPIIFSIIVIYMQQTCCSKIKLIKKRIPNFSGFDAVS